MSSGVWAASFKGVVDFLCSEVRERPIDRYAEALIQSHYACLCVQALPYVALLIVMLFFIYAVIGMQVSIVNNANVEFFN